MLKVLFQSRTTLFSVSGGDTIQIVKTAEYLRQNGVEVDVSIELEPDVRKYDLVHLFNLTRPQETYLQAANARRAGLPVILSPIYLDLQDYDINGRQGISSFVAKHVPASTVEYLKIAARAVANREINRGTAHVMVSGYRKLQRKLLEMTSVLIPNSESERSRINHDFPESRSIPTIIAPNSIDAKQFGHSPVIDESTRRKYEDCVLCVARIEGRKGQLNLVRALKGTGLKLVLIGKVAPNHHGYLHQIEAEADSNVELLGAMPHEELAKYYSLCKVHALVSWAETTGLSSLEAAAMGANLVISANGDTRDYFKDYAYYCDPGSVDSIRKALLAAHQAPRNPALRDYVLKEFIWERTADATLAAYALASPKLETQKTGGRP